MAKSKKSTDTPKAASKSVSKTTSKPAGTAAGKVPTKAAAQPAGMSTSKTSLKPASRSAQPAVPLKAAATSKGKAAATLTPEIKMTLNHDQIAKRAFEIWVAKGRPQGMDETNWKEAEQALTRAMAKRA